MLVDVVDLAVLERLHHGVVVVVELEDDLVYLGSAPEVVGVGLQARELAFLPLHGLEGTGADHRLVLEALGLVRRNILPDVLGQDVDVRVQHLDRGFLGLEHHRVLVWCLDALYLLDGVDVQPCSSSKIRW